MHFGTKICIITNWNCNILVQKSTCGTFQNWIQELEISGSPSTKLPLVHCNISISPSISNRVLLAEVVLYGDLMILMWGVLNAFIIVKGAVQSNFFLSKFAVAKFISRLTGAILEEVETAETDSACKPYSSIDCCLLVFLYGCTFDFCNCHDQTCMVLSDKLFVNGVVPCSRTLAKGDGCYGTSLEMDK
jgi:hypothetical protein